MNKYVMRIDHIASILMDHPEKITNNSIPKHAINVIGKAIHTNVIRVEGIGDDETADLHFKAAMQLLKLDQR